MESGVFRLRLPPKIIANFADVKIRISHNQRQMVPEISEYAIKINALAKENNISTISLLLYSISNGWFIEPILANIEISEMTNILFWLTAYTIHREPADPVLNARSKISIFATMELFIILPWLIVIWQENSLASCHIQQIMTNRISVVCFCWNLGKLNVQPIFSCIIKADFILRNRRHVFERQTTETNIYVILYSTLLYQ